MGAECCGTQYRPSRAQECAQRRDAAPRGASRGLRDNSERPFRGCGRMSGFRAGVRGRVMGKNGAGRCPGAGPEGPSPSSRRARV